MKTWKRALNQLKDKVDSLVLAELQLRGLNDLLRQTYTSIDTAIHKIDEIDESFK